MALLLPRYPGVICSSAESPQNKKEGCEKGLEKLKKIHFDMIAKKNTMETQRREKTKTLFNSLDKIAREEVESLKLQHDSKDRMNSFEIPVIDFEEFETENLDHMDNK